MAEELHLHLLELARAEGEVARRDLVAKALARLGDPEGDLHPAAVHDVLEVDEHALCRFGTQERRPFFSRERPDGRLEHQVEFPRLGQAALVVLPRMLAGLERTLTRLEMIGPEPRLALPA